MSIRRSFNALLLTFFFIIATAATALHELSPNHQAETCPVCVVVDHSLSLDVAVDVPEGFFLSFSEQFSLLTDFTRAERLTFLNARAPPLSPL